MRIVSIPEALERVEETLTAVQGKLISLRNFTTWKGDNYQKTAKVDKSSEYGVLEQGSHSITVKFCDYLKPISKNYVGKEIIIASTKKKTLNGVKVKVKINQDETKQIILQVTPQSSIRIPSADEKQPPIEFPNRSTVPAPANGKARFDTSSIKSMEKQHTNGASASSDSSLTTTFNPQELTAIRDQAAKLSKETADPYLKRAYCELAVAAHNLDSCLLRPVR